MRDSKGISMISLIVTIVAIILLSSLAIGTGTKYIRETRAQNKETFIRIMSSAVARRQEDVNLNSVSYPYLGYFINDSTMFERVFVPKVQDPITFEDSTWYIVDTATARELGVKEPERYIETIEETYTEEITVALVDYRSAAVYLIDINSSEVGGLPNVGTGPVLGHTHRYVDYDSYPTCTEPRKCADCGFIDAEATGHKYDPLAGPKPASGDEENAHYNKVCSECGMQGGYERHKFGYTHLIKDDVWYHKAGCAVCGYTKKTALGSEEERCSEIIRLPSAEAEKAISHIRYCTICLHEVTENHAYAYRTISETMHEKYCSDDRCRHLILREFHYDNNADERCDACGEVIISYEYPQLRTIEIEKTSPTPATEEDKYIAKYGDTVTIRFTADKQIQNIKVTIGGHVLDTSMYTITSSDNKSWVITYKLDPVRTIADGELRFAIDCDSLSGVRLPAPATTTTNNKVIIFDGTNPIVDYIEKENRVDET
jgi:hypothetical protein